MKAMIFAAGFGSRLLPLTEDKPKALVEVNKIPMLEIVIKKLIKSGCDDIIINVHHFAEKIIHYLQDNNNFGINITISDESNLLLNTGGGLKKASHFFDDGNPFIVYNVDILSDIDLVDMYNKHVTSGALATLAIKDRETSRYFLFDNDNNLSGWRNIQTGAEKISREDVGELRQFAFSGIHIINPSIFNDIHTQGIFSITNTYLELAKRYDIKGYDHNNSFWMDLGKIDALKEAEKIDNILNL